MVRREDTGRKYERWALYLPSGPRLQRWKRCLRETVEAGYAKVQMEEVSGTRVDLVWPHAVTWASAMRLTRLANQKDSSFHILGEPHGIVVESAASASAKKRRLASKQPEAASAPAASASSASAAASAEVASAAPQFLPACLLSVKWEKIVSHSQSDRFVEDACKFKVSWDKPLGSGTFGKVYPGRVCGTQQLVAIKTMTAASASTQRIDAEVELRRCVAVANHPDIVNILDVEFFRPGSTSARELNQPLIGLVFELFETDVRQFLKKAPLEIAGMRHVLRKVVSALTYMHELGILHADLKPANILMRPEDFAATEWVQWLAAVSTTGAASAEALFCGCISPRGCIFKVALGDLGSAELACPEERCRLKPKPGAKPEDKVVTICTAEYRPPDLFLGNGRFSQALDMWSLGCVAAELFLRSALFSPSVRSPREHDFLVSHLSFLGLPSEQALGFLTSLPCKPSDFGLVFPRAPYSPTLGWEIGWQGCPPQLADFAHQTLGWDPRDRLTAASACQHSFLTTPCLSASLSVRPGRHGPGSICSGFLHEEVLDYLQKCPSWENLRDECLANDFEPMSTSISQEEGQRRLKREFVGYVAEKNKPPSCKSLNGDANLEPIRSERTAFFARALRRCARGWLHQLQERVRAEIRRVGLPVDGLPNAPPFMDEDLSDNAFAYASVQVLKVGEREDGWHTDGGASLLHAGLTIFGSRQLLVKVKDDEGCISLAQRPGSFYVGNLCALEHNVAHGASAPGSWGDGPPESQVQITVMLRSDLFRQVRARKKDACPGPPELFRIVNNETARHLAEVPFPLPDIAAVLAEVPQVVSS